MPQRDQQQRNIASAKQCGWTARVACLTENHDGRARRPGTARCAALDLDGNPDIPALLYGEAATDGTAPLLDDSGTLTTALVLDGSDTLGRTPLAVGTTRRSSVPEPA